jgi:RimJ/RimL family protein N-acetyltransferase
VSAAPARSAACAGGDVALRPAQASDAEAVWWWNCAPDVRAWSRAGDAVAWEAHVAWFTGRLARPGSPMWIVEQAGTAVGVVRIDDAAGRGRISIALDGQARGRGVGRAAIARALARWRRPVVAEIMSDNRRSRRCFEACGFRPVAERDGLVVYHWEPERS